MLTGMYNAKVDDKGRLSLASRLRTVLGSDKVVVLPGLDGNNLMLATPDYFDNVICKQIISTPTSFMDSNYRSLYRKFISPSVTIELDSAGRINIPPYLREKASLKAGGDALLIGAGYFVEIWNPEVYEKFENIEDGESISSLAQRKYDEGK